MRHRKHTFKVGRNAGHRRSLIANMLKSLIEHERIETSVAKAKELRRHADRMVTLAKKNTLASRRQAIGELMIRYSSTTSKEARQIKAAEDKSALIKGDRLIVQKLFDVLGTRFATRQGGYTRILRLGHQVGDSSEYCILEYLSE